MQQPPSSTAIATSPATLACPLNDGLAVLDQLLAGLTEEVDAPALDIALDLRWELSQPHAPETILREFFRLRAAIEERHYLACYRLRRWFESQFIARVSFDRTQPEQRVGLRLDVTDMQALITHCLACAGANRTTSARWSRVRFLSATPLVSV